MAINTLETFKFIKLSKFINKGIDWDRVVQKKLVPPIVPKTQHDGDTKNFDKYDEEGWRDVPVVSIQNLNNFEDLLEISNEEKCRD